MLHSVYFWLKDDASREQFEEGLRKLLRIDLIQEAHIGVPAKTEERPVTDHSFSYALVLRFENQADHDAYQNHQDHHVFVNECKDLWERVLVLDSEPL